MTAVLEELESLYRPASVAVGIKLTVRIDETSTSESAEANRDAREARVTVTRHLLENSRMSEDGLRTILCHEMGHILGGAPRRNVPPEWEGPVAADGLSFMSSEGQADYYATLVCFRQLVRGQNHELVLQTTRDNGGTSLLAAKCDAAHGKKSEDSLICQRGVAGALNMLQMIKVFPIAIDSESAFVAPKTIIDSYPDRQCRLDTFAAGALCKTESVPKSVELDFNTAAVGSCANPTAARPKCWYVNGN